MQENNLAGVKVMVIDDSNTIRRSAEIFLKPSGCAVILAEDGFDALSKISQHHPDIIFVDIMMPRLDGYQTCSLIKRNPRYQSTPVIMLSSKDGLFDRARGRMVGSDQYLTKPFTQQSLVDTIHAHVSLDGAFLSDMDLSGIDLSDMDESLLKHTESDVQQSAEVNIASPAVPDNSGKEAL